MLDDRLAFLREACEKVGRSIDDLRLSCQIVCAVGDDEAAQHPGMQMFNPKLGLVGSVDQATARARELLGKGITDFNCIVPPGSRGRACLERLVNEVRPNV
jgi:alkanesulfonate monooxygenase SsuD/methylene tetrahydromethanopterin reductase-like flavin-dependent oxidoreductase (luciferase family)